MAKNINFKMEINKDQFSHGGFNVTCLLTDNEANNIIIKKFEEEENQNINESKDAAVAYDDLYFNGKKINDAVICNVELMVDENDGEILMISTEPERGQ